MKFTWTYRIGRPERASFGIETMSIAFTRRIERDISREVAEVTRTGGGDSSIAYAVERCRAIRAMTGETTYFHTACHDESFSLKWQTNVDGSVTDNWYACSVDGASLNTEVVKAISAIVKASAGREETLPDTVIALLKAVPVDYCSAAHEYVPCDAPDMETRKRQAKRQSDNSLDAPSVSQ